MRNYKLRRWGWALLSSAAFVSGAGAQEALVPFVVNVNATVKAAFTDGYTTTSQVQTAATANVETILRIPLSNTGVLKGTQRQANVPAVISNRGGKVTVNLPAQSYGNAEISLYTVNGKQILRRNVSASNAVNNIPRLNIATGAYLLSIRGADGNALASRLTHSGGNLDIDVAFGGGSGSEKRSLQKGAGGGEPSGWRITVSASGYIDESYAFNPVSGMNPRQNITLRQTSGGGGDNGTYESVVIGGKRWMKKNLNIATDSSWCYNNSPDSCAKYGRMYFWDAAKKVCPSGWKLPDTADVEHLVKAAGGPAYAGKALKSTRGWGYNLSNTSIGTDSFGFSALPGGDRGSSGNYYNCGLMGEWWLATAEDSFKAYSLKLHYTSDYAGTSTEWKRSYALSVRCIEN